MNKINKEIPVNKVIFIENLLKDMEGSIITMPELKKKLPKDIPSQSLKITLKYLEDMNKIIFTSKGITWIQNENSKLKKAVNRGLEL
jgi:hypothetical protein